MPISRRSQVLALFLSLAVWLSAAPAHALDAQVRMGSDAGPGEWFSFGYQAYQRGDKGKAADAYDNAGRKGHPGALWKLGRMYAEGDGVPERDREAFAIFETIVRLHGHVAPHSTNAAFVSSAYTALGIYLRTGIAGSDVLADPGRARDLFSYASSYYGDRDAQYQLGQMLMEGEGGPVNARQGVRWLKLSADKGHVGSQALVGYMLVTGGIIRPEPERGLTMLETALSNAGQDDQVWIKKLLAGAVELSGISGSRIAHANTDSAVKAEN